MRIPLHRKMSSPRELSSLRTHLSSISMSIASFISIQRCSPTRRADAPPSTSRNSAHLLVHPASRLNALIPKISDTSTADLWDSMIAARELMERILVTSACFSSSLTRSILFRRILSANAICSTLSFSTRVRLFLIKVLREVRRVHDSQDGVQIYRFLEVFVYEKGLSHGGRVSQTGSLDDDVVTSCRP